MESSRRSVYLITYSDADLEKVPSREAFANIWVEAFGSDFVSHWVCCQEDHQDSSKVHYHLGLKLNRVKRWKLVKEEVIKTIGIVCNFQEFHTNYYDAFKYVTKEDANYSTSPNHPDLTNSPRTKSASRKRRSLAKGNEDMDGNEVVVPKAQKKLKLDIIQVYDIIVDKKLKTEQDLFLLARSQREEGKTDLLEFILKLSNKRRAEIIETACNIYIVNFPSCFYYF